MTEFKKQKELRILEEARYLTVHNCTVREAALYFGVSKSNLYIDVTERLFRMNNPKLYNEVQSVLEFNKNIRHFKGGFANARRYEKLKAQKGTK